MTTNILFSEAFAQAAPAPQAPTNGFMSFVPLILIFFVFYFLLIRPQQKKYKEQQMMVDNLKVGDKVVTSSGIIGAVSAIDNEHSIIDLEVSKDLIIQVIKHNISGLYVKEIKVDKHTSKKKSTKSTKDKKVTKKL